VDLSRKILFLFELESSKLKETLLTHLALLLICFLSLAVELVVLADEEEVCS